MVTEAALPMAMAVEATQTVTAALAAVPMVTGVATAAVTAVEAIQTVMAVAPQMATAAPVAIQIVNLQEAIDRLPALVTMTTGRVDQDHLEPITDQMVDRVALITAHLPHPRHHLSILPVALGQKHPTDRAAAVQVATGRPVAVVVAAAIAAAAVPNMTTINQVAVTVAVDPSLAALLAAFSVALVCRAQLKTLTLVLIMTSLQVTTDRDL